jgi:hypothetical protein
VAERARVRWGVLLPVLGVYAAASLFHHVHNASFLSAYPNLPAWLSSEDVYLAWAVVTAVGVLGVMLLCLGRLVAGWLALGVYAALGFTGLDHYTRAPFSAHSPMMNVSILAEVVAAGALFAVVAWNLAALARASRART